MYAEVTHNLGPDANQVVQNPEEPNFDCSEKTENHFSQKKTFLDGTDCNKVLIKASEIKLSLSTRQP